MDLMKYLALSEYKYRVDMEKLQAAVVKYQKIGAIVAVASVAR
jgi:hypothetical protein